jgi:hypothetical protein
MRLIAPEQDEVAREIVQPRLVTVLCILSSVVVPLATAAIIGGW